MKRAGRTDANQTSVVDILRFLGASVAITSGAGNGFPDLLVGWQSETYLLELKDGRKKPSARKLTSDEQWFVDHWRGRPVVVVESEIEALQAIGFSEQSAQFAFAQYVAAKVRGRGGKVAAAKEKPKA